MTRKEIRDLILGFRGESTTDGLGYYSHSFINTVINEREKRLCRSIPRLEQMKETLISIETTTVAAPGYTAGGATLPVTSAANMGRNRWIHVTDQTNYELVQITSISGTTITLANVLANSYAAGSYVSVDNNFLPRNCGILKSVREWTNEEALETQSVVLFEKYEPKRKGTGVPDTLVEYGICLDREPAVGSVYTMDATTDTDTIVDTELTAASNNYYAGWEVVNITRNLTARVRSYTAATKVLELESAIASQASGDTYFLRPALRQFYLDPIPIADITLRVRWLDNGGLMVSDYDTSILPDGFHFLLVYGTLIDLAKGDRTNPAVRAHAQEWGEEYLRLEMQLRDDLGDHTETGYLDAREPGTFMG